MQRYDCRLVHHGSAAAVSGNQIVTWIDSDSPTPSSTLVYASHALLNIVETTLVLPHYPDPNAAEEPSPSIVRHVRQTLRCTQFENNDPNVGSSPAVITCVVSPKGYFRWASLVSGFSNGIIQVWILHPRKKVWTEYTVYGVSESVTCLDAVWAADGTLQIAAGTSVGLTWYQCSFVLRDSMDCSEISCSEDLTAERLLTQSFGAISSLHFDIVSPSSSVKSNPETNQHSILFLFVGTASPRHNKIHVYHYLDDASNGSLMNLPKVHYGGFLTGHEDWITSFAGFHDDTSKKNITSSLLLASGSQDARIRLWKFRTATVDFSDAQAPSIHSNTPVISESENDDGYLGDIGKDENDDDDDEGESRLEMVHVDAGLQNNATLRTSVTLEALLCGHEESVTSVAWHPDPTLLYGVDKLLISSSLDRTILLWSESETDFESGIWTPLSRVGSAGGILGGSIGSTLLGFCSVSVEPKLGQTLIGHAYGGALHVWDVMESTELKSKKEQMPPEERAALIHWKASPCITGHFAGVTDLCWEASRGDYLLTVSNDQTCRLWAPVFDASRIWKRNSVWLELARPQVHGYNLSAVASLSTQRHPHVMVTGADEKEIRAFDAPKTTLRLLDIFSGINHTHLDDGDATIERVERAYIPSLGLSNKASAADAAAEDDENENDTDTMTRLPLERDLGAVSLWPEIQKLFGHNTEIYCLAASTVNDEVILASAAKARDTNDAQIRIWNVFTGQCVQVLTGGHKSTVATLSFSSDGRYLASSGKDRRLCLWKKDGTTFSLVWARDSAHKRIVWSVHFCPYATNMLASGSRDGCVKLWLIQDDTVNTDDAISVTEIVSFSPLFQRNGKSDAVTALAFAPSPWGDEEMPILALGLESGRIELWCIPFDPAPDKVLTRRPYLASMPDASLCHCGAVTKLAWRPKTEKEFDEFKSATGRGLWYLASGSLDHGCRILEIAFPTDD